MKNAVKHCNLHHNFDLYYTLVSEVNAWYRHCMVLMTSSDAVFPNFWYTLSNLVKQLYPTCLVVIFFNWQLSHWFSLPPFPNIYLFHKKKRLNRTKFQEQPRTAFYLPRIHDLFLPDLSLPFSMRHILKTIRTNVQWQATFYRALY